VAAVAGAGLLVGDGLIHLGGVIGGGTSFSLAAAASLGLWLARPRQKFGLVDTDLQGWQKRLDGLLEQFQALDAEDPARLAHLEHLRQQLQRSDPQLALVGLQPPPLAMQPVFSEALRGRYGFTLHWSEALPRWSEHWRWPERFTSCELLIHHLQMPLSAAELRWIEALPKGQPLWLLVEADVADPNQVRLELSSQLPEINSDQLLLWNGQVQALAACLEPLNRLLHQQAPKLRQDTRLRQLRDLHRFNECAAGIESTVEFKGQLSTGNIELSLRKFELRMRFESRPSNRRDFRIRFEETCDFARVLALSFKAYAQCSKAA
jgi:hypothetical protein